MSAKTKFLKDGDMNRLMASDLTPATKVIAWVAVDIFGSGYPKRKTPANDAEIAENTGVTVRTVMTARQDLREYGFNIVKVGRQGFWYSLPGQPVPKKYAAYQARKRKKTSRK